MKRFKFLSTVVAVAWCIAIAAALTVSGHAGAATGPVATEHCPDRALPA